ncbi:MAG: DUF2752 domain-containing protein [Planctomycetes bacterium]|nr:DUF2752 domain-containing protein [Planctomycetota bacterium]
MVSRAIVTRRHFLMTSLSKPLTHANVVAGARLALLRATLALGALLMGYCAEVQVDGARWFGQRGPGCLLGTWLSPDACPSCGLLRSTSASLHGDLAFAWRAHPAGPVVALLLLCALLLNLDILRRCIELPFHSKLRRTGHVLFGVAVLLGWLCRLIRL